MHHFTCCSRGISLIIPVYNREDLIGETIDCALKQNQSFSEIIVVNDGSSDGTGKILKEFSKYIRVIHTSNQGVQAARNTGVAASKTNLVALCDSDDLLLPSYVETIYPWLEKRKEIDILYCNFLNFTDKKFTADKFSLAPKFFFAEAEKENEFLFNIPDLYKRSLNFQPFFSTGVAFRKSFYMRIGGYDTRFNRVGAEDWEFTLRAILAGNVAACTTPLCHIRRHLGNDSHNALKMSLGESEILEFSLLNHDGAEPFKKEVLETIDRRRLNAFNSAFAAGQFPLAKAIQKKFYKAPAEFKYWLKRFILIIPNPVRSFVWRAATGQ